MLRYVAARVSPRLRVASGGSIPLPYDMANDPRTMRVTYVKSGPLFLGTTGMPGVDELVKKNGG